MVGRSQLQATGLGPQGPGRAGMEARYCSMTFAWCSAVLKLGQHLQAQPGDIGIIFTEM